MDCITELTARATAYLILLQDVQLITATGEELQQEAELPALLKPAYALHGPAPTEATASVESLCQRIFQVPALKKKAVALVTTANNRASAGPATTEAARDAQDLASFTQHAKALLTFVQANLDGPRLREILTTASPQPELMPSDKVLTELWQQTRTALGMSAHQRLVKAYLPPEHWRRLLRVVLYQQPAHRVTLAHALEYWPSLVVALATASGEGIAPPESKQYYLELDEANLAAALEARQCAAPFEVVFGQEMGEVNARRRNLKLPDSAAPDPLVRADELQLCALAFSGGGIRTATFNLGVLQGLASAGWLPRFDYLSTVSGGGYLGSWLVAWIKREGSLQKVVNRLCPTTSPRPNAEEVGPIRWLRMYSNYLAPNASLFSTDAWTVGVTWLRNTLINQLILVLTLGAGLAVGAAFFYGWFLFSWASKDSTWQHVALFSVSLLLPAGILASLGMHMYRPAPSWNIQARLLPWIIRGLVFIALLGAYLTSGFLYHGDFPEGGFWTAFQLLWPASVASTVGLVVVAAVGSYDRCFHKLPDEEELGIWRGTKTWLQIIVASTVAAVLGQLGMTGLWWVLHAMRNMLQSVASGPGLVVHLASPLLFYGPFILGLPLVLETVTLTVVARMAFLGRDFPDERREWWGRLGAVIHLAIVVWILLTSSTLLAREFARVLSESLLTKFALGGGWLALVGKAVQLAFSARTPAKPGTSSSWLDKALALAPYIFGLGLLMLTSGAIFWLLRQPWLPGENTPSQLPAMFKPFIPYAPEILLGRAVVVAAVLGAVAWLLGWRVGVNEFSLHHFYRNRLVRAYLGASRPRVEREQTANPFTSFDRRDDVKLCSLRRNDPLQKDTEPTYEGPYLLINVTLNATKITDLAQQNRQAESFVFSPLYCGFDFASIRALDPTQPPDDFGYRPTQKFAYSDDNGPSTGTAMAISGAAANPNEGYHSSPAMAFLLTLFNVRLGWWLGNPRNPKTWNRADPQAGLLYLLNDLFGRSTTSDRFVNLSDGGHFDNMGLYELVRRRCRYIVLGDGEEDHLFTCEGLANAIRRCRVDFGIEITIDVTPITDRTSGYSRAHYAVGKIWYPDDPVGEPSGRLLYIKASLTGDEPTDVREYAQGNKEFPHQSTADQFFSEAQFESYRRLGLHLFESMAEKHSLFRQPPTNMQAVFDQLAKA